MSALAVTGHPARCHACDRLLEPGQLQVQHPDRGPLCLTCHTEDDR